MDIAALIPSPDTIPVHWVWFKVLLIITFMAHILLMNIMLGSAIIAFFSGLNRFPERSTISLQKEISEKTTFVIAFTINFGVAPLLFLQVLYGNFFYTSSILMAVFWISVIFILIIAYYSAYIYKFKFEELAFARVYFIGLTVLLLTITAFFYTNNMTMMLFPASWTQYFDRPSGTVLNLSEPTLLPRFIHFVTASVAISGLFIAITWQKKKKSGSADADLNVKTGMKIFFYATLFQVLAGIWFFISLPKDIMLLFMGKDTTGTMVFLAGLIAAGLSLIFGYKNKVRPAAFSVLVTVFFMVIMRDMVRTAFLKPYFSIEKLKVIYQYSPMIVFFASLIIGIAAVIYMIKCVHSIKT
ncbi:MAG: hypothetical protein QG578_2114 [Thermodesulfobacteriota bacterium]|nr:hypothetical protein [Thermodesulfobacteriota bacterium]